MSESWAAHPTKVARCDRYGVRCTSTMLLDGAMLAKPCGLDGSSASSIVCTFSFWQVDLEGIRADPAHPKVSANSPSRFQSTSAIRAS